MTPYLEAMSKPEERDRGPARWRVVAGDVVYYTGLLSLPAGVGAVLGFYAADRGVRWLPTFLEWVLVLLSLSIVAILGGRWIQGTLFKETKRKRRLRTRILVCLVLGVLVLLGRLSVFWMQQPSPLTELTAARFNEVFEVDRARYVECASGLESLLVKLASLDVAFEAESDRVLTPDEERLLLDAWVAARDYAITLDRVRVFYEDWFRFDPSRAERSFHLRSFLLTYAAELALYEKGSRLTRLVRGNPNAVKFLDAPDPGRGLPADTFSRFRQAFEGARDQARVLAGEAWLEWLEKGLGARDEAAALGCAPLWNRILDHLETIDEHSLVDRLAGTATADLEPLKRRVRYAWLPVQTSVAELMGNVRVRRVGTYLITDAQVAELDRALQPGDILLARKNWYLSNVGLPGFWPHGILYLGDRQKLVAAFTGDPAAAALLAERAGRPVALDEYLAERHPTHWAKYGELRDGHLNRVIEAIAEGVVFNPLEHSSGDYLVALRPRLDPVDKLQAILEAFGHAGKPYDYEFDFATGHALVCTELIWRSYRPAEGKRGLDIPLVEVVGRKTLPANEIARLFAEESGRPEAQLEFVYFLEGNESTGAATVSTQQEFLRSHLRSKWDIAQP